MITISLERMRSEGTLKQRKGRNPLNYEATPRNYELGDEMRCLWTIECLRSQLQ